MTTDNTQTPAVAVAGSTAKIDFERLLHSIPKDVLKKISLHDIDRIMWEYNRGLDPLAMLEAERHHKRIVMVKLHEVLNRLETIRETHKDIHLDRDIESGRAVVSEELGSAMQCLVNAEIRDQP